MSLTSDLPTSARRLAGPGKRPSLSATLTDISASDWWYVPIGDLTTFLNVVGGDTTGGGTSGTATATTTTGGGVLARMVPLQFQDYPFLYANSVRPEWVGWDEMAPMPTADGGLLNATTAEGGPGYFAGAYVQIGYVRFPYSLDGSDAFLEISGQPSERTLEAPTNAFTLDGGTARTAHNPSALIPGLDYSITIHRLSILNESFYAANARSVNDSDYRGNPRGTVLFKGLGFNSSTTLGGVETKQANIMLSVSPIDWNMERFPDGSLGKLVYAGTTDYRYPYIDFQTLFPS